MTRRGIALLEFRIRQYLPFVLQEVLNLDPRRYYLSVLEVRLTPDRLRAGVRLGLRFLPGPSFCCQEPGCHLGMLNGEVLEEAAGKLAKRVGLPVSTVLKIEAIDPLVEGAQFRI